jgi:diamine N-acetyltransferase
MNPLTNGNISLRALEPEDIELLYYWENQSDIWRVSNTYAPVSRYMLANYLNNAQMDVWESKSLRLVIEDSEKNAIGTIELFDFEPYHMRAGLGIVIFTEGNRRKGYAIQSLSLFIGYVKETLGLRQLFVNVGSDNQASLALFSKLGFEIIGIKKDWTRRLDGWLDEVMMQKFL